MTPLAGNSILVNAFECNLESCCPPLVLVVHARKNYSWFYGYVFCSISLIADYLAVINPKRKRPNMQVQNANPPIQVTGRHVSVTEAMKEYCRRRLACLHLDYPKIIEVQILLDVQKYRHTAEVILHCSNHITLEASAESDDMYVSVDEVVDKIARQMRKYKTRLMRQHRPRKHAIRHLEETVLRWEWVDGLDEASETGLAARVKPEAPGNFSEPSYVHSEKYPVKPMFIDEAVLQIEMSSKQFLVFLNAKTEKVNVIYRRKNGDFGLIEPTFN
jgi:putative sigma-54 modulation protein